MIKLLSNCGTKVNDLRFVEQDSVRCVVGIAVLHKLTPFLQKRQKLNKKHEAFSLI